MEIFLLNILSQSYEDNSKNMNPFAGRTKQECLDKAFSHYSNMSIDEHKEEDENFVVTEEVLLEVLGQESDLIGYEELDWTHIKISDESVDVLPNR